MYVCLRRTISLTIVDSVDAGVRGILASSRPQCWGMDAVDATCASFHHWLLSLWATLQQYIPCTMDIKGTSCTGGRIWQSLASIPWCDQSTSAVAVLVVMSSREFSFRGGVSWVYITSHLTQYRSFRRRSCGRVCGCSSYGSWTPGNSSYYFVKYFVSLVTYLDNLFIKFDDLL